MFNVGVGIFERTRSAQDFGAGFACGEDGFGVSVASLGSTLPDSSVAVAMAYTAELALLSTSAGLTVSDFEETDSRFGGRAREGRFGTAGTIGCVLVVVRATLPLGTGGRGLTAEDGVVGCVESASDGVCDVAGVAELAASMLAAGTGGLGEVLVGSGCGSSTIRSGISSEVFGVVLCGSSTGVLGDCGRGFRFLRLLEDLGKVSSGTEYQKSYTRVSKTAFAG